ncbi:MAG: hypothetical protein AAFX08_07005 [Pseudomonadota bacterium]
MKKHLLVFAAAATALTACDRIAELASGVTGEDAPQDASPDAAARDDQNAEPLAEAGVLNSIPVTDRFEPNVGAVQDVAFWSHPTLAFASLTIIAGENGLSAHVVENGAASATLDGRADAIEVAYLDDQGVIVGVDGASGEVFLATIDNISQEIVEAKRVSSDLALGATGLCLATDIGVSNRATGFVIGPSGIAPLKASKIDGEIELDASSAAPALDPSMTGVTDCVIDPTTGVWFALAADGGVWSSGGKVTSAAGARSIGLMVKRPRTDDLAADINDENGADTDETPAPAWTPADGPILALMSDNGEVSLIRASDGVRLGAVFLGASFDYPAIEAPTALALGVANYGGVYRDGAIAVGDGGAVSLIPWNAVANRFALPIGDSVDPRRPQPAEDDSFRIEISPTQP